MRSAGMIVQCLADDEQQLLGEQTRSGKGGMMGGKEIMTLELNNEVSLAGTRLLTDVVDTQARSQDNWASGAQKARDNTDYSLYTFNQHARRNCVEPKPWDGIAAGARYQICMRRPGLVRQ